MKAAFLPLALLLLFQACKKPDNATPPPATAKIKTLKIEPLDGPQAGQPTTYRFTYNADGRVDTMQLFGGNMLGTTTISKHYPSYIIRRNYLGATFTPDYMADSFTISPDGQITGRYLYTTDTSSGANAGILMQTLFSYNSNRQLASWTTTLMSTSPTVSATSIIDWNSGDAVRVDGEEFLFVTGIVEGTYTYDTNKPGQPAHPLAVHALTQWGQPLIQCAHHAASQDIGGYQALQNTTWANGLISGYETYLNGFQKVRMSFTYY